MGRLYNIDGSKIRPYTMLVALTLLIGLNSCYLMEDEYPSSVSIALDKAGENREELVRVIENFSQHPRDSLKLEAVYFLIRNMPGHSFHQRQDIFQPAFDSTVKYQSWNNRTESFNREIKKIKQKFPSKFNEKSIIEDIHYVNAGFLIDNVELAFMAYDSITSVYSYDFNLFLRYVLPYRNHNEPLEFGSRKHNIEKYEWAQKQLRSGTPLLQVAQAVIDSADLRVNSAVSEIGVLSSSEVEKSRFGLCSDLVNYMVNVFRSIGIPTSHEFTPLWGNHHRNGHDWMVIHGPDSLMAIDAGNANLLNNDYRNSGMAKAYRVTYENQKAFYPFTKDVTTTYKDANQIFISRKWGRPESNRHIFLSVFDKSRHSWRPVARPHNVATDSVLFKDIGTNVVYLAGYYDQNRRFKSLNNPFIVNSKNQVEYLDPNSGITADSLLLTRKYPPFHIRRRMVKMRRIEVVNTLKFQGSYDSTFASAHDLLSIKGVNSTHPQTFSLSYNDRYPYYRLQGPDTLRVQLAKLKISSPQPYRREAPFPRSWFNNTFNNLADGDALTYWGSKNFMADFIFDRPAKVTSLTLQARNDDNHITIGDSYELFYWDKGWQSLSGKVADDTLLVYQNVPKDALYWLRNRSRGQEEHVFTITNNGKQWWPGVSKFVSQ